MAETKKKRAGYQDVVEAPAHMVAEVVEGDLHLSPRPGKPHGRAAARLTVLLEGPFGMGRGGPGGWVILMEPEVHLASDILVPDLAGWRSERSPLEGDEPFFSLVPDWICEIVSPRTAGLDRIRKLPIYASHEVKHAWIVDPSSKSLEVYRNQGKHWLMISTHEGAEKVRAEPFDAIELELAALWPEA